MTDRAILEFYATREVGVRASYLLTLETSAPPPPDGAIINIGGEDYLVLMTQYSIDQPLAKGHLAIRALAQIGVNLPTKVIDVVLCPREQYANMGDGPDRNLPSRQ